MAITMIHCIEF